MSMFKKAEKKNSKLRLGISAPSGGGKTYTTLEIATGIAEATGTRIAVIDTEKGSASLYADRFDFDVLELKEPFTVEKYIDAIQGAEKAGYGVLIVDSMTHGWKEILAEVNKIANAKFRGNTFMAWGKGTPLYDSWVNAMLSYDGHILMTSRSKTEHIMEKDEKGKTTINKVGLGSQNRGDFEYECTMYLEGTHDHLFTFSKDRTGKYQGQVVEKPNRKLGKELVEWLNTGVEVKPKEKSDEEIIADILVECDGLTQELVKSGVDAKDVKKAIVDGGCSDKIATIKELEVAKSVLENLKKIKK